MSEPAPIDLEKLLEALQKYNVTEFQNGTLSIKFGPGPKPVTWMNVEDEATAPPLSAARRARYTANFTKPVSAE